MKFSSLLILLATLLIFSSCGKSLLQKNNQIPLKQYADGIIEISSEYNTSPGPWSSFVVLGAPDTYPEYGDIQTAWAPKTMDGSDEYLALAFDTAQYVDQIEIYETYNPGAVTIVEVRNTENQSWVPVYYGDVVNNLPKRARIMKIDIPLTAYLVDAIRFNIASKRASGWNEIDAVSISGIYEND